MSLARTVRDILREDRVEGDILRVLAMGLGSIWFSELVQEVNAFNSSLGTGRSYSPNEVLKAIRNLERMGIIEVREAIKAVFGEAGGVKDYLVSIKNLTEILPVIVTDRKYVRYKLLLREYFKNLTE